MNSFTRTTSVQLHPLEFSCTKEVQSTLLIKCDKRQTWLGLLTNSLVKPHIYLHSGPIQSTCRQRIDGACLSANLPWYTESQNPVPERRQYRILLAKNWFNFVIRPLLLNFEPIPIPGHKSERPGFGTFRVSGQVSVMLEFSSRYFPILPVNGSRLGELSVFLEACIKSNSCHVCSYFTFTRRTDATTLL